MRLKVSATSGQWIRETSAAGKVAATGLTKAMRETGRLAAAAANKNIHAAGFKNRKWEMRPKNYPAYGVSLLPEVWLHSRVNFEEVFEEGRTIVGNPWLWLPLPSVPKWPGDPTRQMSPKKYVETIGPLVSFKGRAGKTPILAAKVRGGQKKQPWGAFVNKARLRKRGEGTRGNVWYVPLFVGVKTVTIEKRFDVMAAVESVTDKMEGLYAQYEGKT